MNRFSRSLLRSLTSAMFLFTSSAQADVHVKVINGHDATPGAWPFMVALVGKNAPSSADGQFCGGSLIGPQHILTAAHCVTDDWGSPIDPRDFVVQIGGDNLTFNSLNGREVLGLTVHPKFDPYYVSNDLAILKLKEPVGVTPIDLALSSDAALYAGGTSATVIGYGKTDPRTPILPFVLQEANIPLASDQTCMNELGRYFNPATQLCAGVKASSATSGDGIDSCNGDSGGPLFVSDGIGGHKQVGVVSWGMGYCANEKTRGVYSKIMANDAFVTSFPMAKPLPEGSQILSAPQNPTVGSILTCTASTFYGDAPTQITYRWYRSSRSGSERIAGASSSTYITTDLDNEVLCTVEASNAAGSTGELLSNQISLTSTPPPPQPPSPDTTQPTGSIRALTCSTRACSFVAIASDDMSGVSSVKASVELSYLDKTSKKTKGTQAKKVTIKRIVRAESAFNTVWEGQFRLARKIRQHVKVTLLVRDSAGNNNMAAATRVASVLAD